MAYRYLLSSGLSTTKIEEYVMDLIKINLSAGVNDIPGRSDIGMDTRLTGVMKDELQSKAYYFSESLVSRIQDRIPGLPIEIESVSLISETRLRLILRIDGTLLSEYIVDLE